MRELYLCFASILIFGNNSAKVPKAHSHSQQALSRLRKPSDNPLLSAQFEGLLTRFSDASDVFAALQNSQSAPAHGQRFLDNF